MIANIPDPCGNLSIVLPTPGCLSGATVFCEGIAAVDGHSPYIYLFDGNGCFTEAVPARRPYGSISTNDTECFVCCGCGCDSNIYFLNDRFEETGAMTPDGPGTRTVSASFYTEAPFDNCVAVTFDRSVKLFKRSGEYVSTLKHESSGVNYLCCQSFPGGECTALTEDGAPRIILDRGGSGEYQTLSCGNCSSPRAIILKPCGDLVCVIGYRYLYNYIIPLITDGVSVC